MTHSLVNRAAALLTLAIAFALGVLTLMPPAALPISAPGSDKLHHLLAFAALVLPAITARPASARWVAPVALSYGALIELIQPSFGRAAEWADLAADASGIALGFLLGWGLHMLAIRPMLAAR